MGSLTCCIWWLVFGILLGWLLAWWLGKLFGRKPDGQALPDEQVNPRQSLVSDAPTTSIPSSQISRVDMVKAAAAAGISFSGKKNDLEIIEGIGPKIAELMNENGIHTFDDLSKASLDTLHKVLEGGGDKFRLANPSTWAEQALLAAENKWQELKTLQDNLDGGVKKP